MKTEARYCNDCGESTEQELVKIQKSMILSPVAWACRKCKTVVDIIRETPDEMQARIEKEKVS